MAWRRLRVRIPVRLLMVFRWNTEQLVVTTEGKKRNIADLGKNTNIYIKF